MAKAGGWDVTAGTEKEIKVRRKDVKVKAGAVEHKNRPEAVYVVISSWVKPKLAITKAKAIATSNPEDLAIQTAIDFDKEVRRAFKQIKHCFDSKYFDPNSIIPMFDYTPTQGQVGKRQFMELEVNIDTANTIGMDDQPAPNPQTGKVEMYSFKELESHIVKAVDKILGLEAFDEGKAFVSFDTKKGAK